MWNVSEVQTGLLIGAIGGAAIGYELRKIVERFQRYHAEHKREIERINQTKRSRKNTDERDVVTKKPDAPLPPVIPIKRTRRSTPQQRQQIAIVSSPDRDEVIDVLMGSGFSKTEAVKAVDACSLAERASGVEAWTRAAFTNAARKA